MVSVNSKSLTFKPSTINSPFMVVVIVSKKTLKKAVDRNKLKRRIREMFKDSPTKGVVYTRKGVGELTYKELRAEVEKILNKLKKGVK